MKTLNYLTAEIVSTLFLIAGLYQATSAAAPAEIVSGIILTLGAGTLYALTVNAHFNFNSSKN